MNESNIPPTEPKEYRFKTFQELVAIVPADKIELCMSEMGKAFAQAKEIVEMGYQLMGVPVPPDAVGLPEEFGWIDDGKCVVTTQLAVPGEKPFMTITTEPKQKPAA